MDSYKVVRRDSTSSTSPPTSSLQVVLHPPEMRNLPLDRLGHLHGHLVDLAPFFVVHHGVAARQCQHSLMDGRGSRKHEQNVPFKLVNVGYRAILDAQFDRLQIHWLFDNVMLRSARQSIYSPYRPE